MNMSELKYTLSQRIELAKKLRANGYVCSQCVIMAFPEIHSLTDEQAASLSIGLGGGIGGQGGVCGCVTSMAMLAGFASAGDPKVKPQTYSEVRQLSQTFERENGSIQCRELKTSGRKPCLQLIEDAVTIMHNRLEERR